MDITLLVSFLSPFLPHLLKLGQESATTITKSASEALGTKFTDATWQKAQSLWKKLRPKVDAGVIEKVTTDPENPKRQAVLEIELEDLFNKDTELKSAIAAILNESSPDGTTGAQIIQTVTGDENITIGQVYDGNITITNK